MLQANDSRSLEWFYSACVPDLLPSGLYRRPRNHTESAGSLRHLLAGLMNNTSHSSYRRSGIAPCPEGFYNIVWHMLKRNAREGRIKNAVASHDRIFDTPFPYYPRRYLSNQFLMCCSRSMRSLGWPPRERPWLCPSKRTKSVSRPRYLSAAKSCSACSILQRKSCSL